MSKNNDEPNCPQWPHCSCVMQGFVNYDAIGNCGRKPKVKQHKPAWRHPVDEILESF